MPPLAGFLLFTFSCTSSSLLHSLHFRGQLDRVAVLSGIDWECKGGEEVDEAQSGSQKVWAPYLESITSYYNRKDDVMLGSQKIIHLIEKLKLQQPLPCDLLFP